MNRGFLESLVGDVTNFERNYWRSRPHLKHGCNGDRSFAQLFSLTEADEILSSPYTRPPYVELRRGAHILRERNWTHSIGKNSNMTLLDSIRTEAVAAEFAKGATIVMKKIDDYHLPIRTACEALGSVLHARTGAVVFITPPNEPGLGLHFDTFEGFVVQVHGSKRWEVYPQLSPLPSRSMGLRDEEIGPVPALCATLEPGDSLYIPWGSPHRATSGDDVSCHLTFMCVPFAWQELLLELAIAGIPPTAHDSIPKLYEEDITVLDASLQHYVSNVADSLTNVDAERYVNVKISEVEETSTRRAGFLRQEIERARLDMDSVVARDWRIKYTVRRNETGVVLELDSRKIKLPEVAFEVLVQLEASKQYVVLRELPVDIGSAPLLSIISSLIANGLVRVGLR